MAYKKLKFWFDEELGKLLAKEIIKHFPKFNKKAFLKNIKNGVDPLELKGRVELIADELHTQLGMGYEKNTTLLLKILGPENEEETGMFTNFYWIMPLAKYVEKYGLDHFDLSMKAICEITKRNTGEYTIRPYLEQHQAKTLKVMLKWSKDKNRHVRRLASEGVRPRLPWASKLQTFIDNPKPILKILENLKDDPSKYVQKSVANCINDILKDNLEIGKTLVEQWAKNPTPQRKWIIKHALRNLLKQNTPWALKLIEKK